MPGFYATLTERYSPQPQELLNSDLVAWGSPSFVVKRTNSHAKHVYPRSPGSANLWLSVDFDTAGEPSY